nr:MAG TPA: GIY-YIG nuclease superfamily protein [Caudoviricetes sp.]
MYHYVYKIIQLSTRKEYIGIHSTDDFNDGYMGSGTLIKPAVDACPDDFVKTIIWMCDTREEAEELESTLVTEEYLKENFPERTFNQVPGGKVSLGVVKRWQRKLYPNKSRVGNGANAGKIKVTDGKRNMWIYPEDFDEKIHSRDLIKSDKKRKARTVSSEVNAIPEKIRLAFANWKSKNKSSLSIEKYNKWEQRVLSKNKNLTSEHLIHLRKQVMKAVN